MKRSSSIAALDDTIDVKLRDGKAAHEEKVLVTSMMLVTIDEENRQGNRLVRKGQSNGSMSARSSFSRSSSRGSLRGWGSTASRKSYKIDLCALADSDDDFNSDSDNSNHRSSSNNRRTLRTLTLQKGVTNNTSSAAMNQALDSWGFFLD
mmetsp:Transcript_16761/g.34525  ORF Transcript_16761/g.34525 Transcript_16761/m.34525 type:complete len:150 (-) Transcript_16761:919-1368(-)